MQGYQEVNISVMADWQSQWCYHTRFLGSEFLQKLVKDKKIHEARAFNFTFRYIDDVLSINNSRFAEFLPLIYPPDICRRSWYIAAHVWKIYDFKIEVVPFIINFSTELTTVVKFEV
jgi:hypothetical protein